MRAIRPKKTGGPEVLVVQEFPTPEPGFEEVRVRVEAACVSPADLAIRSGTETQDPPSPLLLGTEGAGIVEALGPGVSDLAVGERVAWIAVPGSYTTHLIARRGALVRVPEGLDAKSVAAAMKTGVIAHYLARDCFRLGPGTACLINSGLLGPSPALTQVAKKLGAMPIVVIGDSGGVGTARGHGAAHVFPSSTANLVGQVRDVTGGKGVDVVYDQTGGRTLEALLKMLKPRGLLAIYGAMSAEGAQIQAKALAQRGSLFVTRPRLKDYVATPGELEYRAAEVFEWMKTGALALAVDAAFPLSAAKLAHQRVQEKGNKRVVLVL